jgi:hypothetical protein
MLVVTEEYDEFYIFGNINAWGRNKKNKALLFNRILKLLCFHRM